VDSNIYANLDLEHFINGRLDFDQVIVDPGIYKFFVVSEETPTDTVHLTKFLWLGNSFDTTRIQ
jgi:hypothetical protein